jgi:sigma-E factor negative regulatory protein RseA
MDGELSEAELAEPLNALKVGGEALEAWRKYHLISDALRDTQVLSPGFSTRFAERLAQEPTILAPMPRAAEKRRNRLPLSMAASFAAVAMVGWVAFQGGQGVSGPEAEQVAQSKITERAAMAANKVVPMPGQVNDYLLAHQHYSPRSTLQGVAPYVRSVSDTARPR